MKNLGPSKWNFKLVSEILIQTSIKDLVQISIGGKFKTIKSSVNKNENTIKKAESQNENQIKQAVAKLISSPAQFEERGLQKIISGYLNPSLQRLKIVKMRLRW